MHSRRLYVRSDIYYPIKDINGSKSTGGNFNLTLTEQDTVSRLRGASPHLLCNFVAHLRVESEHKLTFGDKYMIFREKIQSSIHLLFNPSLVILRETL
jgi:hypothetical protein